MNITCGHSYCVSCGCNDIILSVLELTVFLQVLIFEFYNFGFCWYKKNKMCICDYILENHTFGHMQNL